jgi:hypothetical protein
MKKILSLFAFAFAHAVEVTDKAGGIGAATNLT